MSEPEPHDCPQGCHPLRARDGVSPACSDDCQKPLGHAGPCDDPMLAERRRDAAWSGRLAAVYASGHTCTEERS
jgi:hypothetical protein